MAIPPCLQVTRVTLLLLVKNSDNSDFQQFNKIFNSPEAVELLKFLKVDFVWNSSLRADQNSTIQQFNSLGNTQNVKCLESSPEMNLLDNYIGFVKSFSNDLEKFSRNRRSYNCQLITQCSI